jgi:NAD(P)-dependent dehydrogenase (short-subunit alcohol dehydrogenase family)
VNLFGALEVTQAFAPVLAGNGGGALANVSSVAALANFPALLSYSASKAALHSLTQATRILLKKQGTYVAGIYPGPVDTDMGRALPIEKAAPADVAREIFVGLAAGEEEIFPDPVARQMGQGYLVGPKETERAVAAMAG